MAHVLNYPVNTSEAMDRWRADAGESEARRERANQELRAREEADCERRLGGMTQAQSDAFNSSFDARFTAAFAAAVAEGSAFDKGWVDSIAEALAPVPPKGARPCRQGRCGGRDEIRGKARDVGEAS